MSFWKGFQIFLSILLGSVIFIGIYQLSHFTYENIWIQTYSSNTIIGNIDVSGLTKEEAKQHIQEAVLQWEDQASFSVAVNKQTVLLENRAFHFDIDSSIESAVDSRTNPLVVNFNEDHLQLMLKNAAPSISFEEGTINSVIQSMEEQASYLLTQADPIELKGVELEEVQPATKHSITIVRSDSSWNTSNFAAGGHIEFQVQPGESFSFLQWAQSVQLGSLSSPDLSKLSSLLWEGVLSTELAITERHISESLPEFVTPGLEAQVDKTRNLDFAFVNSGETPVEFRLIPLNQTSLSLTITQTQSEQLIRYSIVKEKVYPPRIVIQYVSSDDERVGQTEAGKEGYLLKIVREYIDTKGNVIQTEVVAEDSYLPKHEIEFQARP